MPGAEQRPGQIGPNFQQVEPGPGGVGGSNALLSRHGLPSPHQAIPGHASGEKPQSLGQPAFLQLGGSLPGVPEGEGQRDNQQQRDVDRPLDLAESISAAVEQARVTWNVDFAFDPAWWLRDQVSQMYNDADFDSRATGIFALPPQLRETQEEKRDFLHALRVAWSLVAYEQLDGEHSSSIYEDARNFTDIHNTTSLTLSTLGVTFLDAMAQAIDLPDYTPGQTTFDLYPFSGSAAEEKIKKNASSLAPTNEEVRKAINPMREQSIDAK